MIRHLFALLLALACGPGSAATDYPDALDEFANPGPTTQLSTGAGGRAHSAMHADTFDAIEAMQALIGVTDSADPASIMYRVNALEEGAALDGELACIAALTSAADRMIYYTGSGTCALATLSAFARTVLDDADAAEMLGTIGAQPADADLLTWAGITPAAGIGDWLATPSSANLATAVTGETGSGALVFGTSPTLTTPALGTPSVLVLTNATGLPLATGVTGQLPFGSGGTGLSSAADDTTLVSGGSAWVASALTDCNAADSAVTYDTATNAWGCNTIAGGGTPGGSGTPLQYRVDGSTFGGIPGTSYAAGPPNLLTLGAGSLDLYAISSVSDRGLYFDATGGPINSGSLSIGHTANDIPSTANLYVRTYVSGTTNPAPGIRYQAESSSDTNVAAGFGPRIEFYARTGHRDEPLGNLDYVFTDSTNGSEDADAVVQLVRAGTVTEALRVLASGGLEINSAYALPAADGTVGQVLKTDGAGAVDWGPAVCAGAVQEFTSSGTWTKPTGAVIVRAYLVGAGGGGASGTSNGTATLRGGAGGGAGRVLRWEWRAGALSSSESVTVGAGGGGGAGASSSAFGNPGSNGGSSAFGGATAPGGNGAGNGGTGATGGGGFAHGSYPWMQDADATSAGGSATTSSAATGGDSSDNIMSTGGGAGGWINGSGVAQAGARGGQNSTIRGIFSTTTGGTAGAVDSAGGAGTSWYTIGTGGGGGGASTTTAGGIGGAGGFPGGGGGGGGAAVTGQASGAGGAGADGYVLIETECS